METQRLVIAGRVWAGDDSQLQDALARVHATPERPRCLCVPGGIEMYVARHGLFVVKRMPDTGSRHDPACPSFEPEAQQSGLGELIGDAVLEPEPGRVELRVDFPWTRINGRSVVRADARDAGEVGTTRQRMSLRALMHYLFERAGFNRWSPAMEGRRNQGVLHKYLLEAAREVTVKGLTLTDRLYVPEPFSETGRSDAARAGATNWPCCIPMMDNSRWHCCWASSRRASLALRVEGCGSSIFLMCPCWYRARSGSAWRSATPRSSRHETQTLGIGSASWWPHCCVPAASTPTRSTRPA